MAKTPNKPAESSPPKIGSSETETPTAPTSARAPWRQAVWDGDDNALKRAIHNELIQIVEKHTLEDNYLILMLYDDCDAIANFHADRLYAAASEADTSPENILLIIQSLGGSIEPAYLISKALKRIAQKKFVVAVPRRAKSAATLISLGADEIRMGMMSQLGPIDPQQGGLPVLALGNALDLIVEKACEFPAASDMLAKYLANQIPSRILGYHKRVGESAAQYAERLLADKTLAAGKTPEEVARHLVNHYKDHGFVIDSDEIRSLLGDKIVCEGTPEYKLADEIFRFLDFVRLILGIHEKEFWHVGEIKNGFQVRKISANT